MLANMRAECANIKCTLVVPKLHGPHLCTVVAIRKRQKNKKTKINVFGAYTKSVVNGYIRRTMDGAPLNARLPDCTAAAIHACLNDARSPRPPTGVRLGTFEAYDAEE